MNENTTNEIIEGCTTEVDLLGLLRLLGSKLWMILISMVLCGAIAFVTAVFTITPTYTASAMLYVNNSSASVGGVPITISSSQISAAKSLLDTYVVILKTRTTLEAAIEKADLRGKYTYGQLSGIVSASSVNDTDIFRISATCADRDDALLIVDTLVEILPDRISDIVDGSSVRVVDHAVRPSGRSSPSYTKYGVIGVMVGAVLSAALIIVQDLLNNTVRGEEYLKQRYNIPILAIIPEAYSSSKGKYKYGYKAKYKYGYHGRYGYYKNGYVRDYADSYEKAQTQNGGDK